MGQTQMEYQLRDGARRRKVAGTKRGKNGSEKERLGEFLERDAKK